MESYVVNMNKEIYKFYLNQLRSDFNYYYFTTLLFFDTEHKTK